MNIHDHPLQCSQVGNFAVDFGANKCFTWHCTHQIFTHQTKINLNAEKKAVPTSDKISYNFAESDKNSNSSKGMERNTKFLINNDYLINDRRMSISIHLQIGGLRSLNLNFVLFIRFLIVDFDLIWDEFECSCTKNRWRFNHPSLKRLLLLFDTEKICLWSFNASMCMRK